MTETRGIRVRGGWGVAGLAVAAAAATLWVASPAEAGPVYKVVKTIKIGPVEPFAVTVAPGGKTVYVADYEVVSGFEGVGGVSVISAPGDKITRTIKAGVGTAAVAVAGNGKTLYAANVTAGTLSVIGTAKEAVTATVKAGNQPLGVVVSPDSKTVYVANGGNGISGGGSLTVINASTGAVKKSIALTGTPDAVAVSPNGDAVYIANSTNDTVSVITAGTETVVASVKTGSEPNGIAVSPNGADVYVANEGSGTVTVISAALEAVPAAASPAVASRGVRASASVASRELGTLTCVTAKDCVGAGLTVDAAAPEGEEPLLETWNGTRWADVPVKLAAGEKGGALEDVSCMSARECFAIGSSGTSGASGTNLIVESGGGDTWKPVALQANLYGLNGVSCVPAYCGAIEFGTAADIWNRSTWSEAKLPQPAGKQDFELDGISCVRPRGCVAVGGMYDAYPAADIWNGSKWAAVKLPQPKGTTDGMLVSVSCVSLTRCFAVGNGEATGAVPDSVNFVDVLNGTEWTAETLTRSSYDGLSSISCTSAKSCLAVGASGQGYGLDSGRAYAASWNGKAWKSVIVPIPPHGSGKANGSSLTGVSCLSAASCVAVGEAGPRDGDGYGFSGTWNGKTWKFAEVA